MPRASKRQVKSELLEEMRDNFAFLISSLSTSSDIQNFFTVFLTEEEKIMLTKRLMLHLMLKSGYEISEMCALIGVSRETIRTHKNVWTTSDVKYKNLIAKIAERRKTKEFWKKVEKSLKPLEYALSAKTNMKSRAKLFDYLSE